MIRLILSAISSLWSYLSVSPPTYRAMVVVNTVNDHMTEVSDLSMLALKIAGIALWTVIVFVIFGSIFRMFFRKKRKTSMILDNREME